jgi:putative oxidoreductase
MFDFDLSNGYVILRIICGAFMLPQAWTKVQNSAPSSAFFVKAGYPKPHLFVIFVTAFEFVAGIGLVLGIKTVALAWVSAFFMLVATISDLKVNKAWLWTKGGCEYPLFWCLSCAIVAAHA